MRDTKPRPSVSKWYWWLALLGLAWNLFGVYRFLATTLATVEGLVGQGLTQAQAELYVGLPVWMNVAFALGVYGGTLGCLLLLLCNALAKPVFAFSLAAYAVLYLGDITQGVFAAFGSAQVTILTTVVAIAAGLQWLALQWPPRSDAAM
jgi:hypothetical protein